MYVRTGQGQKGLNLIDESLELDPENERTDAFKGMALLALNQPDRAYAHYEYLADKYDWYHIGLPQAMIRSGHADKMERTMDSLYQQSGKTQYFLRAVTSATLGRLDQAILECEKFALHETNMLMFLNEEPLWDPIQHQPEFKKVLQQKGFPEKQPESFSDMLTRLYGS